MIHMASSPAALARDLRALADKIENCHTHEEVDDVTDEVVRWLMEASETKVKMLHGETIL